MLWNSSEQRKYKAQNIYLYTGHSKNIILNERESFSLASMLELCLNFVSKISIGNYTVPEVLMKNRTSFWRNVYNIINISPNTSEIFH